MDSEIEAALDFYQLAECVGNPSAAQDGRSASFLHGQALAAALLASQAREQSWKDAHAVQEARHKDALTASQAEVERLTAENAKLTASLNSTHNMIRFAESLDKLEGEEPTDEQ